MSPRKPTVDGLDDTDDEDGLLDEERAEDTDLTLHEADENAVGLGHTPPDRDEYVEDRRREESR